MIFTGFKRKSNQIFLNRRLPDLLKKSVTISSEGIKQVLVFLDDISDKNRIQEELLSLFGITESDMKLVVFKQKLDKGQDIDTIITPKDFGWYGGAKSDRLKNILTKKYDLLINYSKVDNLYINILLLQCEVGFRVGFAHLDNRFYDLIINCKQGDLESFNKELKKYLVILNKI